MRIDAQIAISEEKTDKSELSGPLCRVAKKADFVIYFQ